jgi:polyhydroxyalkanoate synthesis regulator phasin
MRKTLATLVIGAVAAVGITAGAAALAPTAATAQEDGVVEETAGPLEDILGELVAEGIVSQDQADIVGERIRAAAPFHRMGHHRSAHLEVVAELLDMEAADVAEALRDGQSIADLAGDDTQSVIDALVTEATERLTTAVDDGRLTQEEADEKLGEITQRITNMVNGERPEGFDGRRGPGPRGGGFFGPPVEEASSTNA